MAIQERDSIWRQRISDYRSSKLSAAVWCQQNNITVSALRYWIGRLNKENREKTDIQWISLDNALALNKGSDTNSIVIEIGKATIHVSPGFSENTLLRILKVLHAYA